MANEPMTCHELVELVTDYLEGPLPESEKARLEAHLAECDGCTEYLEQMRRTIELTGRLSEESIPPVAKDRLLEAFRDWKRGEPVG